MFYVTIGIVVLAGIAAWKSNQWDDFCWFLVALPFLWFWGTIAWTCVEMNMWRLG